MPCSDRARPTVLGLRDLLDLDSADLAIDELLISDRAGPTVLDIPILSDLDSTDLAIDELPILPPLLRIRLPLVLQMSLPMPLTTPSPLDSRDSPAIDANPSLSSLSVSGLVLLPDMSPVALGTSLRLPGFENGSAPPETGMRIGSPPSHPKNPRGCLIPHSTDS